MGPGFESLKVHQKFVFLTQRVHPFPSRTRKLSSAVAKILGGKLPGKIAQCQHLAEYFVFLTEDEIFCIKHLFYRCRETCHRVTNNLFRKVIFAVFAQQNEVVKTSKQIHVFAQQKHSSLAQLVRAPDC